MVRVADASVIAVPAQQTVKATLVACGMRRGGSTLQFQLIGDILKTGEVLFESEWISDLQDTDLAATESNSVVRVIKTHSIPKCSPASLSAEHVKCFYICRDPRDALVSYLAKYESAYSDELAGRFFNMVHGEFKFWSSLANTHVARYETVVASLAAEVASSAREMGICLGESQVGEIAKSRSLENQKKRIEGFDWGTDAIRIGKDLIDPGTQLHSNHIRTGGSGGWRTELTADAVLFLETRHGQCILDMGYVLTTSRWSRLFYRFAKLMAK